MVGNEFVRGLSGGERKRTTITEAMVSRYSLFLFVAFASHPLNSLYRSAINCWDCSTRGLDAASALDYATSLRIITETLHKTTIASFYQVSNILSLLLSVSFILVSSKLTL